MPQIFDTYMAPNVGVKSLIYGQAGIGKTLLCSTAPYPIILSAEQGLLSLRRLHVPYMVINTLKDLQDARIYLTGTGGNAFQTLCLDSVSEIADTILNTEKKGRNDPRQAYGEMADRIVEEFRLFRNLPKHVVFTAQMGSYQDGLTGGMKWGPFFPGRQLDQKVPYLYDEMFQLLIGKNTDGTTYRVLRTQPDNQYEAKDRSGSLDPWEYPDLTHVFNKIMGTK